MSRELHLSYVLAILLFGASCSGSGTDAPDLGAPGADLSGGRTDLSPAGADLGGGMPDLAVPPVSGSVIDTYVTEAMDVPRPVDLSKTIVAALVLKPGGIFASYLGTGLADGTFSVPDVPAGTCYLKVGNTYLVTSARRGLDLGRPRLGRPDAVHPAMATSLTLKLSGLNPWQSKDGLQLLAVNNPTFLVNPQGNALAAGATALNTSFDFAKAGGYLIDGGQGDKLIVTQNVTRTAAGKQTYYAAGRSYTADAFTMTDGQGTTLMGAFGDVPQSQTLAIDWKRSLFDPLKAQVHARARVGGTLIDVLVQPGAERHGTFGSTPDLLLFYGDGLATDVSVTMKYGNPYPAAWSTVGAVEYAFLVGYGVPGNSTSDLRTFYFSTTDPDSLAAQPVQPLLTPARDVLVNGKPASGALTGVTTTPTVSWTAPMTGTADLYQVQLTRLYGQAGKTRAETLANLYTRDLSVTIPPDHMKAGEVYLISITAFAAGGMDLSRRPFRRPLKLTFVSTLTETLTP